MNLYDKYGQLDYLAHHGIKGQEWGKRHGPPYPLAPSDHSASEREAGWRSSLTYEGRSRAKGINSHITNINTLYKPAKGEKLKLKKTAFDPDRDLKAINPRGYTRNCMNCTIAYELRRRGYDVEARQSAAGFVAGYNERFFPKARTFSHTPNTTNSDEEEKSFFGQEQKKAASKEGNVELAEHVIDALTSQGDGARGNLMLVLTPHSGHSVAYEVNKGKVSIIDAQEGRRYSPEDTAEILKRSCSADFCRLDNVELDESAALYAVRNKSYYSRRKG